ncbi:MAG TPA: hypothetical protein VM095_01020, partial [Pyrinomonadaceae bacterium]|nr:hypothetical protein [Pyrinomonadaceae bacterium]
GEAVEAFKETLKVRPGLALAHFNLGLAYLGQRDRASALEQYEILKTLDPALAKDLYSLTR